MPKAQNLYYYMDEDYKTINRVYGLLSKSYDPQGEHLEVLVDANSDTNLCTNWNRSWRFGRNRFN